MTSAQTVFVAVAASLAATTLLHLALRSVAEKEELEPLPEPPAHGQNEA